MVETPRALKTWLSEAHRGAGLLLYHEAEQSIASLAPIQSELTLLIGCEGGLNNEEIQLAEKKNFFPVRLGPRILRTETAALAAISTLQAKWGDFR